MSIVGRWKAARLRKEADRSKAAAVTMLQSGRFQEASEHIARAFEAVTLLARAEPENVEHVVQLAGIYYNNAAICEQLGNLPAAVNNARQSVARYLEANGGDIAPENVPLIAVFEVAGSLRPPTGPPPRELVPLIADAKARLSRLLARSAGPSAADEVHALGSAAVATYQRLAEMDPAFGTDLRRVHNQYARARRHLDDGA